MHFALKNISTTDKTKPQNKLRRRYFIDLITNKLWLCYLSVKFSSLLNGCSKEDQQEPFEVLETTENDKTEIFHTALSIPPNNSGENHLIAQKTTTEIQKGISIGGLGYQAGSILGPSFSVYSGSPFQVTFQNNLNEPSNIHWHGLMIPEEMDGHPSATINSGEVFNYHFTVAQRAGMYWYHPHPHNFTPKQVYTGLAGLFFIKDEEEDQLRLPSGDYELPLVIQDKKNINTDLTYHPTPHEIMEGHLGQKIIINGKYQPYKEVDRQHYRLRILNGSNARILNLAFSDGSLFDLIGNDGGLLSESYRLDSVLLAPGERADIIVDFSKINLGTEVYLINQFNSSLLNDTEANPLLKFIVKGKTNTNFILPNKLSDIVVLKESMAQKKRSFILSEEHHPTGGGMFRINDKSFDANRIDVNVKRNTIEIWEFDNTHGQIPHPMHLHGALFQILSRSGGRNRLLAIEKGWKDTVLLMPQERVSIIIPFGDKLGKYVFHCHNLEHEHEGMMLQYAIES